MIQLSEWKIIFWISVLDDTSVARRERFSICSWLSSAANFHISRWFVDPSMIRGPVLNYPLLRANTPHNGVRWNANRASHGRFDVRHLSAISARESDRSLSRKGSTSLPVSKLEERSWRRANYGHAILRRRARILVRVSANISYAIGSVKTRVLSNS